MQEITKMCVFRSLVINTVLFVYISMFKVFNVKIDARQCQRNMTFFFKKNDYTSKNYNSL